MLILLGELDADLLSSKVEGGSHIKEGTSGFAVMFVFDQRKALDGAEVLAALGVLGDIDVVQRAEGREHGLHLSNGDVARKVAHEERLDVARIRGDRGRGRRRGRQQLRQRRRRLGNRLIGPANTRLLFKTAFVVDELTANVMKRRLKGRLLLLGEGLVP